MSHGTFYGGISVADIQADNYRSSLPNAPKLQESQLEQAVIDKLQYFLLELGRGFSFVARQKRIRFDDKDFYVDLVFYNYLLKCFVLKGLKLGELSHQDIGQMDGYVRMYEAHAKVEGDNPTIGLIHSAPRKMLPLPATPCSTIASNCLPPNTNLPCPAKMNSSAKFCASGH